MATIDQFAIPQGWRIRGWHVDHTEGPIPANAFTDSGTLLIGTSGADACNLAWLDQCGTLCAMTDLPFDATAGSLHAAVLFKVNLGGKRFVDCNSITLWIDDAGVLNGTLVTDEVDGNTGTFAADAHPSADGSA